MAAKNIYIAYFSGTGGTALAAKHLSSSLKSRGANVTLQEIKTGVVPQNGSEDMLVLLFAVHAFNAPLPVYKWLEKLNCVNGKPAAVIAVSGGGEMSPNTGCRRSSISRLRRRGYNVVYEDSIVMPCNYAEATPRPSVLKLMQVLPERMETVADDLLAGITRRLKAKLFDRFLSRVMEVEKLGAKQFGKNLYADETCTGCGWCADNCTSCNIVMNGDKPVFGKGCSFCLRCIYGCPTGAIKAKHLSSVVIKEGLDISALEKEAKGMAAIETDKLPDSILWKGVKKYLYEFKEMQ
jgi:ferredoxin/flavodoxin